MALSLPQNTIIEIVGNVGTGKTTFSRMLAKKLEIKYLDIDPFVENPFLPLYVKNRKKWAFATALHFSYSRSKLISNVIATKPLPIVLDHGFNSGLFMYPRASYKLGEMTKNEWEFLKEIHYKLMESLPPITISIFLTLNSKTIVKRLKKRGRPHEAHYSQKYIEQLQKGLDEYKNKLKKEKLRDTIIELNPSRNTINFHGKSNILIENALC